MPIITLTDEQIEGLNQLCKVMHHLQPWMKPNDSNTGLGDYLNSIGTILNNWNIGTETLYSDYLFSGMALARPAVNSPQLVNFKDGIELYNFGTSNLQQAYFSTHLLHDIKAGSIPTFHVHWTTNTAGATGDMVWNIEYMIAKGYGEGVFPNSVTVSSTMTDAVDAWVEDKHYITNDDDMPIDDPTMIGAIEPDALILGRIYRNPVADPNDTFTGNALLIQVDMHYEVGQIGTTERNRPFTSAGFGS